MREKKIHLDGLMGRTLCGIKICGHKGLFVSLAKTYKEVTCERCKKTWTYRSYLEGKFREKP